MTAHQLDDMRRNQIEVFRIRAIAFARQEVPGLSETDDTTLRAALDQTMAEAEALRVRSEQGIVMLYCASLLLGQNIFELPQARDILEETHRSEQDRLEALIGAL